MSQTEFGTLNLDEMMGESERLTEGGQADYSDKYVQMPKGNGSVTVRILPPSKGGKLFQYTRLISINGRNHHCPKPLINGKWDRDTPNPIIDYYNSLWRKIDVLEKEGGSKDMIEKLKAEARSIKPVERYYYNVIVRKTTDKDGNTLKNVGPKILSVGKTLHKQIVASIVPGTDRYIGNVTDVTSGRDFVIRKELVGSGSNAYPKYDASSFAHEQTPLGTPEEVATWCANLHDLSTLRRPAKLADLEYELAVHRGCIKDTKATGFNADEFDKKWKNSPDAIPEGTRTEAASTATAAVDAPAEDRVIDDASFEKELEGLKDLVG